MKARTLWRSVPSVWASCLFGATLLAGACVAPEFTKSDPLAGSGGLGGVGGATNGSATQTTSGGSDAGGSNTGGAGGDGTTESSTTQATSTNGGSSGAQGGSGGSDATNGGAAGSSATTSTTTGSETDCGEGFENCSGECVSLDDNNEHCGGCGETCTGGTACIEGSCECGANETVCEDQCVNTSSDVTHCGACGSACTALEECNGGECECVSGYTACSSGCVQTSSNAQHCGSCGNACDPGEVCSGGSCRADCGAGLTECDAGCVNTDTSLEHCGGCNDACDPGFECSGGTCVCSGGLTECGGACVDTESSEQHCNGCDMPCGVGESCNSGSCVCSGGTDSCGGHCVNTDTNNAHCGACDTPCDTHCEGGQCVSIPGYWTEGALGGCAWTGGDSLGSTYSPNDFTDASDALYCVAGQLIPDYEAVAIVGFNVNQPPNMQDCSLGNQQLELATMDLPAMGDGIAVRFDVDTLAPFRIQLSGPASATDDNDRWCAYIPNPDASGRAFVPFAEFNTQCWEGGSGIYYSGQPVVSVLFLVAGGSDAEPFDFCIHGWTVGDSIEDAP